MKLHISNFFYDIDLSPFFKLFKLVFNEHIELGTAEDSDILLESLLGSGTALYSKKWLYTFLFIGESDSRLPIFIENGIHNPRIKEYSCIFKGKNSPESNSVNFPRFAFYLYSFNFTYRFKKQHYDNTRYKAELTNRIQRIPSKDVCVIISDGHDSESRNYFLDCLDKRVKVDYAGHYKNNTELVTHAHCSPGFIEFVSQYKVIITMENSKDTNYITENILNGFAANTVPVYWGADNITDYFNEERFINVKSFSETDIHKAIDKIVKVLGDDETFIDIVNKPIYTNNHISVSLTGISSDIRELLGIQQKQRKRFITFGGPNPNYHKSVSRVCKEAQALHFFDEVVGYTDQHLKNDVPFWEKHGRFIESNHRGYGYWIWKSHLIQRSLDEMNDNDILIYCDAGCQINMNGKRRLNEYIDMLNTNVNDHGLISFQLEFKELMYTKKYIFDKFQSSEHNKNSLQCIGGIQIIKKNEHSVQIINEWCKNCMEYNLINDNIATNENPAFKDNRHDQSVLSVLVNKHGSIKLIDETYFHPNWNVVGAQYPFWAKRIK